MSYGSGIVSAVTWVAFEVWVWLPAGHSGLWIQNCHSCGIVCSCSSDLIPVLGTSTAKRKKKKKERKKKEKSHPYLSIEASPRDKMLCSKSHWENENVFIQTWVVWHFIKGLNLLLILPIFTLLCYATYKKIGCLLVLYFSFCISHYSRKKKIKHDILLNALNMLSIIYYSKWF